MLFRSELAKTIDQAIGTAWRFDAKKLHELKNHVGDKKLLEKIGKAKLNNKKKLATFIKEDTGIEVSPHAIFDVQIINWH